MGSPNILSCNSHNARVCNARVCSARESRARECHARECHAHECSAQMYNAQMYNAQVCNAHGSNVHDCNAHECNAHGKLEVREPYPASNCVTSTMLMYVIVDSHIPGDDPTSTVVTFITLICAKMACRAPCTHAPCTVMLGRLQQGVPSLAAILLTCQTAMLWRRLGSSARPRCSTCSKTPPPTRPDLSTCAYGAALPSSCSLGTDLCACIPMVGR